MIAPNDIAWENAPLGATHLNCISHTWMKVEGDSVLSWNGCWSGRSSPAILGSHHVPRPVEKPTPTRVVPSAATHFDPVKEAYYCASLAGLFVWVPEKERWVSTPDLSLSDNAVHLHTDREHPLTVEDWERGEARMDIIGPNGNEGEHYEEAFPCKGYEKLHNVFRDAHHHAAYQKGAERHANDLPFHEQRMQTISEGQDSPLGMAFQVQKKMLEGLQMKDPGACRRELLGALNYLAGIVIFLDKKNS